MEVCPLSRLRAGLGVGVGVLPQVRTSREEDSPPPALLRKATSPASGRGDQPSESNAPPTDCSLAKR